VFDFERNCAFVCNEKAFSGRILAHLWRVTTHSSAPNGRLFPPVALALA